MATFELRRLTVVHGSHAVIEGTVFDDSGAIVDLTATGVDAAICIARNPFRSTPDLAFSVGESTASGDSEGLLTVELSASDFDNGVLNPRLFGHWYSAWYHGNEEVWQYLTGGPLTVQPAVPAPSS